MILPLYRQPVTLEGSQRGYFAHLETRWSFAPMAGEIRPVPTGWLRVIFAEAPRPFVHLDVPGAKLHNGSLVWHAFPRHGACPGTIGHLIESGQAGAKGIRLVDGPGTHAGPDRPSVPAAPETARFEGPAGGTFGRFGITFGAQATMFGK